ncbi:hypothetical protein DB346_00710 [Verrucomicrobia bacterium LW23]|nr:hypothetical protein DB346_00710 [Verrucomicrobia bacterium LW23]
MKDIVAREQVRLSAWKCLRLSLTGMSFRLGRSIITVSILALAVAFLSYMITYGLISHDTRLAAGRELEDERLLGEFSTRLTSPDSADTILANLNSTDEKAAARRAEYERWSQTASLEEILRIARQLDAFGLYIRQLPVTKRAVLTGDMEEDSILALARSLGSAARLDSFLKHLNASGEVPMPGSEEEFRRLIQSGVPLLAGWIEAVQKGQLVAIARVQSATAGQDIKTLLAGSTAGFTSTLEDAGFHSTPEMHTRLRRLAQHALEEEKLRHALTQQEVRYALARKSGLKAPQIDMAAVLPWITSARRADDAAACLSPAGIGLSAAQLLAMADRKRRTDALRNVAGASFSGAGDRLSPREGIFAFDAGTRWLIGVSFIVCAVGVANAMLMSVTERFTEIATMKCLGALNSFVMQIFFFEALVQGMVGGLAGLILGTFLAVVRSAAEFGTLAFHNIPYADLFSGGLAAWLVGLALAAGAAISPVWMAARLAPMEAMRME